MSSACYADRMALNVSTTSALTEPAYRGKALLDLSGASTNGEITGADGTHPDARLTSSGRTAILWRPDPDGSGWVEVDRFTDCHYVETDTVITVYGVSEQVTEIMGVDLDLDNYEPSIIRLERTDCEGCR